MRNFSYRAVEEVGSAVARHTEFSTSAFLAGGTTLIDLIKLDVMRPEQVVDVNRLPLKRIDLLDDGRIRIGALVSNTELAHHPLIRARHPLLSAALLSGASTQLRNMATTAGNLMQRTRCAYFRDPVVSECNKREPGSGCAAATGINRLHAVLGTSEHCVATHPSDMCVALAAIEGTVEVEGPGGKREVALLDFHLLPGDTPQREHALEADELITSVVLAPPLGVAGAHYLKLRDRASYEFALASCGVVLVLDGQRIGQVRIALGGVATKPWRAFEAEASLVGVAPGRECFEQAARLALAHARPLEHNAFKLPLARQAIVRALETALDDARGGMSPPAQSDTDAGSPAGDSP
ncbi:FAD binding domain-containing protein [Halotalea alkalilenta]|uniref:Xanthine dehydrogenase n=1 Tax=Halotalea alkalilenta TaxID=376489 RepID=A0A172YCB2_9GAMM|nr:xanthine dehydrogenase family protein subunit M [Halotalea alkalilenta]ANF56891.1 xanthine dehydrogenase [Halotalea alkalilenta]